MIKLLLADVLPLDNPAVYDLLYDSASSERRAAADSFRFRKDRNLSLGAAALLDRGLRAFGFYESDMSYGHTDKGKPFFLNAPDIHFNISHSSSKVAVALSDREVGCDIEEVAEIDLAVAERFFSPAEYEAIMQKEGSDVRLKEFFRYWTLKESYMKAIGMGMSLPPNSFSLSEGAAGYEVFVGAPFDRGFEFKTPDSFKGYECAICYRPGSGVPQVEHVMLG